MLSVPTQLLAGCLSNSDGGWPFSSSLQTTWPLRCLWLRIIHWWCPSHESLRLCIQTLTRLTGRQRTQGCRPERAGWMEMSTSGQVWQVSLFCDPRAASPNNIAPHFHIHLSRPSGRLTAEYAHTHEILSVIWMKNSKRLPGPNEYISVAIQTTVYLNKISGGERWDSTETFVEVKLRLKFVLQVINKLAFSFS